MNTFDCRDEIERLRKEVVSVSRRIHDLKSLIEETEDPVKADKLTQAFAMAGAVLLREDPESRVSR